MLREGKIKQLRQKVSWRWNWGELDKGCSEGVGTAGMTNHWVCPGLASFSGHRMFNTILVKQGQQASLRICSLTTQEPGEKTWLKQKNRYFKTCCSKYYLRSNEMSITWELFKNATSWATLDLQYQIYRRTRAPTDLSAHCFEKACLRKACEPWVASLSKKNTALMESRENFLAVIWLMFRSARV